MVLEQSRPSKIVRITTANKRFGISGGVPRRKCVGINEFIARPNSSEPPPPPSRWTLSAIGAYLIGSENLKKDLMKSFYGQKLEKKVVSLQRFCEIIK